ncbi:hypothetical protein D9M72_378220 [compost metagenome]
MRLRVGVDLEAAALDLGDGVGRRGFDPVDLARQQRGGARVGLGHRHHHHLVDLWHALRVPVLRIAHHFQALARHQAAHPERPGAGGVGGKRDPGLLGALDRIGDRGRHRGEFLLPLRGRGHEQVGQVVGQERIRLRGDQLDGEVVDLPCRAQRRHARGSHADLAGIELPGGLVQHFADVPNHGVGVERGAVVELDARAQLEYPSGLVGGVDLPFGGQARDQQAGAVAPGQVPLGEAVVHRDAGEAVALKTLVGLAERARDVGGGHADAQHLVGMGGTGQREQRQHGGAHERGS